MFGYRVPAPDEAMLISGRGGGKDGQPFKVVIGHGTFVVLYSHATPNWATRRRPRSTNGARPRPRRGPSSPPWSRPRCA